jgi:YggT family protein
MEIKGERMFVLGNFIVAVAKILDMALTIYMWIIIGRAVISWVNADPYNPIVQFLYRATEPVMAPIRRWIPIGGMGIDISPIIIIFVIFFLQSFLVRSMIEMAYRFG